LLLGGDFAEENSAAMLERILVPTDLSPASNSIFPHAVTLAQSFHSKLYLLHVMDPASLNEPENLVDFPKISRMFPVEYGAADLPPLKKTVPVAKIYAYHRDVAKAITQTAKNKNVDLICMASTHNSVTLTWWSAGRMIEQVIKTAPCSVLCMRGRPFRETDWKRPRFKHILLLVELSPGGAQPFLKILPWVHTFNSMLHIFPLLGRSLNQTADENPLREVAQLNATQTNVLLFADPQKRMRNLMNFVRKTPIDLIAMSPRTRAQFSNRLISDILVKLLAVTQSPILLLR
jgi:nucleotide-binding universal stress UspA family protein